MITLASSSFTIFLSTATAITATWVMCLSWLRELFCCIGWCWSKQADQRRPVALATINNRHEKENEEEEENETFPTTTINRKKKNCLVFIGHIRQKQTVTFVSCSMNHGSPSRQSAKHAEIVLCAFVATHKSQPTQPVAAPSNWNSNERKRGYLSWPKRFTLWTTVMSGMIAVMMISLLLCCYSSCWCWMQLIKASFGCFRWIVSIRCSDLNFCAEAGIAMPFMDFTVRGDKSNVKFFSFQSQNKWRWTFRKQQTIDRRQFTQ